jgi:hypothetical protein
MANQHQPAQLSPISRTQADQKAAQTISDRLLQHTFTRLLNSIEPFTERLILREFPVYDAYPALVGFAPPPHHDFTNLLRDGRSQLCAIGGTFWERVAITAALIPPTQRLTDGKKIPDETLFDEIAALLQRLGPQQAVPTWVIAVVDWLNTCNIDVYIREQYRHPYLKELHHSLDITQMIAWREAAYIELFYR